MYPILILHQLQGNIYIIDNIMGIYYYNVHGKINRCRTAKGLFTAKEQASGTGYRSLTFRDTGIGLGIPEIKVTDKIQLLMHQEGKYIGRGTYDLLPLFCQCKLS
ncbi:hypothetical protein D3C80_1502520 [compost metagenome]